MKKLLLYILILLLIISTYLIEKKERLRIESAKRNELNFLLHLYNSKLQANLKAKISVVTSIEALIKTEQNISQEQFNIFAASLIADNPPLRALQYADEKTVVKYVFPYKKNEITIKNKMYLIKDKIRGPYVKKAIKTKRLTIQGPFQLRQGGLGLVARAPIFKGNRFYGLAIGVYNLSQLFDEVFSGINISKEVAVAITDKNNKLIKGRQLQTKIFTQDVVTFADLNWTIKLYLQNDFMKKINFYSQIFYFISGSLILTLFLLINKSINQNQILRKKIFEKSNHLNKINQELCSEIQKRKETQDLFYKEKLKYQSLYENAPVMFLEIDTKSRTIIDYNKTFCQITGYSETELVGRNIDAVFANTANISFTSNSEELSCFLKKKNTECIDASINIKELESHNEKSNKLLFAIIDATEKNKLIQIVERNNKMEALGKLASGISHDFNNILSAIIGYSEIIHSKANDNDQLKNNITEVLNAALRAKELVRQILSFSRSEEIAHKDVDVKKTIHETLLMLKATIPNNIRVFFEPQTTEFIIKGNQTKLHQIILNLITNSIHAIDKPKGIIKIELASITINNQSPAALSDLSEGNYIKISVSDNGQGIKNSDLANIFDPYFTTKDKDRGTGLGLSVVHNIITSHEGSINVYSEYKKGTTFTIYLPSIKENTKKIKQDINDNKKYNILIIDDEPSILDLQTKFLETQGYNSFVSPDPLSALKKVKEQPCFYDLIVTDFTMPGMNGEELIDEIKKINPEISIVLCTGLNENVRLLKNKIQYHILKPIDLNHYLETINSALNA